jgi:hypothetical protein
MTARIITVYDLKQIRLRHFDWVATYQDYDGPGSPVGFGRTEQEAIADLQAQVERRPLPVQRPCPLR